ncbi:unnamed protein product [Clonostachys solani]|uniref:Uncharacterized protein n=1 Tax=Clonostachys solani TaxID=160281 RepID=A0A9N9ZBS0_9HYPO|nr:unnamed protein product [Clonostachys solani]
MMILHQTHNAGCKRPPQQRSEQHSLKRVGQQYWIRKEPKLDRCHKLAPFLVRLACFGLSFLCWTVALLSCCTTLSSTIGSSQLGKILPIYRDFFQQPSRMELQALSYMLWVSLSSRQPISPEGHRQDHAPMIVPTALVQYIRRRH